MGGRGAKSPLSNMKFHAKMPMRSLGKKKGGGGGGSSSNGNKSDGTYKPWHPGEKISDSDRIDVINDWKKRSTNVRHAIQGRPKKNSPVSVKQAQLYDDWLNNGSFHQTIYRGKEVTLDEHNAILSLKPGDVVHQNGPSSFSKSESKARSFAHGMYSDPNACRRVVFVLEKGTDCGRDISHIGGLQTEQEVNVGSASKLVLTKAPETKVIGGEHYTYIYGTELKTQYVPSHANQP